eukprot:6050838-Amphidinium_carterae.1
MLVLDGTQRIVAASKHTRADVSCSKCHSPSATSPLCASAAARRRYHCQSHACTCSDDNSQHPDNSTTAVKHLSRQQQDR